MIPAFSAELIVLALGSFGRSSPMDGRTQLLFGVLVVGISLVGLALIALGFKSGAATTRRFAAENWRPARLRSPTRRGTPGFLHPPMPNQALPDSPSS